MAGHAILPGCRMEWRHDCPGRDESVPLQSADTPAEEIRVGGVICSCPCHRLKRVTDRLGERVVDLEGELARVRRHRTAWTTGYRR